MSMFLFHDRSHAGRLLAKALSHYADEDQTLILALPRGGVPVAAEMAKALRLPLDIWLVRKLGIPGQEELAMGAIALGGVCILNHQLLDRFAISDTMLVAVKAKEEVELQRRNRLYRGDRPAPEIRGKTILLVDDGIATGATMRSALQALRQAGAARLVVAVPVGVTVTCQALKNEADEVVCLFTPEPFYAVGQAYQDFGQTSDEEVQKLLRETIF